MKETTKQGWKLAGRFALTALILLAIGFGVGCCLAYLPIPGEKLVEPICACLAFFGAALGATGATLPPNHETRVATQKAKKWRDTFSVWGWALVAFGAAGTAAFQVFGLIQS